MKAAISIFPPSLTSLLWLAPSLMCIAAGQGVGATVAGTLAKAVGPGNEVYGIHVMKFERPTMVSRLRYSLYTKPKAGLDIDRAAVLSVVGRDESPDLTRVYWMDYFSSANIGAPSAYAADLTFETASKAFLIAAMRARGPDFVLQVHRVQTSGDPLVDPRQLDVERLEDWPPPREALGSVSLRLDDPPGCVATRIKTLTADGNLIIHVFASGDGCQGMILSFSMSEGGWKRLRIEPEDVKPRNQ